MSCSASHDKTSKEMLPLPSKRIIRSGKSASPRKNMNIFPRLRIMGEAIFYVERPALNS